MHGKVDAMRLLLDHPSANPPAMLAFDSTHGKSAFIAAAKFAAESPPYDGHAPTHPCAPLLLLLRRIAVEPQPSDAQQAHMTKVMEALCQDILVDEEEDDEDEDEHEERFKSLFDDDQPDDARDESIHLLIEHGADAVRATSPVMKRIIREHALMARVPQRINEAVLGIAIARQQ
jgi:hypothetical protein